MDWWCNAVLHLILLNPTADIANVFVRLFFFFKSHDYPLPTQRISWNLPTFYIFKYIFEALPKGIFKKEKHFYIVLFHDLLKSGVKISDFSL